MLTLYEVPMGSTVYNYTFSLINDSGVFIGNTI